MTAIFGHNSAHSLATGPRSAMLPHITESRVDASETAAGKDCPKHMELRDTSQLWSTSTLCTAYSVYRVYSNLPLVLNINYPQRKLGTA